MKIFECAIQAVLKDKGFQVPSNEAAHALETAGILTKWTTDCANEASSLEFCDKLLYYLQQYLPPSTTQASRESMWSKYHQLRTSTPFKKLWEDFLKISLMDDDNSPILYQYISTFIFKELIKEQFPAPLSPNTCSVGLVHEFTVLSPMLSLLLSPM